MNLKGNEKVKWKWNLLALDPKHTNFIETHWFPNSAATKRNPDFSTHILAATGTVSKYFRRISVTCRQFK